MSINACVLLVLARPRRSIAGSAADPESTRCCPPCSRDPAAQICTSFALSGQYQTSQLHCWFQSWLGINSAYLLHSRNPEIQKPKR
ncbi:hypothetical protein BJX62DRAFT_220596 [Aspergillus germanicus]